MVKYYKPYALLYSLSLSLSLLKLSVYSARARTTAEQVVTTKADWFWKGSPHAHKVIWNLNVVVDGLPLVLVLPLQGCGCPQGNPSLGLTFAGLWLCSVFPQTWSCLCWAVVVHRLPLVLVLTLLVGGCAEAYPGLGLSFAGMWLCIGFPW